jgi:bifunctional DNA-binding transcriptional regulator/antitoxin component of YhaV-PrlF toxin-antitoxin module
MTKVISINKRGTLTLPRALRERIGLSGEGQVVAEETSEDILIRDGGRLQMVAVRKNLD